LFKGLLTELAEMALPAVKVYNGAIPRYLALSTALNMKTH